ncbi:MAG: hypothetical protein IT374_26475 [Polyangiaceae bacterium]|nr:hypothetical protein [Polyangiaceae bacterium]
MTTTLTLPAAEVLAGTTRVTALEHAGYRLDAHPDGQTRVYRRGEVPPGLDLPSLESVCVMRREADHAAR